jgi:molybdopterin converting factor subunit 1
MKLDVRLFATLKERVGASQISIEIDESATVSDLLNEIFRQHPNFQAYSRSILVAVNQEYAYPSQRLKPEDEIAIFPPVSGG